MGLTTVQRYCAACDRGVRSKKISRGHLGRDMLKNVLKGRDQSGERGSVHDEE